MSPRSVLAEDGAAVRGAARCSRSRRDSLIRGAPGLLLLAIIIADWAQLTDPDLWGHIYFGQAFIALGHLVRSDPYSYTASGAPWRDHEWLSEVVMALAYSHWGVVGLKLWKFGCVMATVMLIAAALQETGASLALQLDIVVVAAVALAPCMEFRPQLFTFVLFAAILLLLARDYYRKSAPLWLAIPILALWANLHGGFIAGLAALAVYTLTRIASDAWARRLDRRALRLIPIGVCAAAATLLTPSGIGTWYAVARALTNPMTRLAVNDWQPLLFALGRQSSAGLSALAYYGCALAPMGAALVTFVLEPGDFPLAAIAALMIAAAFTAVRNLPLAVIACSIPLASQATRLIARRRERAGRDRDAIGTGHRSAAKPAAWIVAVALAIYGGLFSPRIMTDRAYPAGAVAFMASHRLQGNILCDFGWGEYLIWHAPRSKVFIDGRYDTVYPLRVIRDYLRFYFSLPGGARVLDSYPHDFVLIPPRSPAYLEMARAAGWTLVYRDNDTALFARVGPRTPGVALVPTAARAHQFFP